MTATRRWRRRGASTGSPSGPVTVVVRFAPPMPGVAVGGQALLPAIEAAILDGLAAIDVAATAATDGRRARTHPEDPLPGFTALVRPGGIVQALRRRRSHAG